MQPNRHSGTPDLYLVRGFFFLPTDGERVAYGRGPTREASQQSAKRNWDGKFVWSRKNQCIEDLEPTGETRATEYGSPMRMEGFGSAKPQRRKNRLVHPVLH
jgi:hypothetical protein